MSRIGNKAIDIPSGVTVSETHGVLTVKGPKGQVSRNNVEGVIVSQAGSVLSVSRSSDSSTHRANHGLIRSLLYNMVVGVSTGFERKLVINGVGYKAEKKSTGLLLNLGYSHPIDYVAPEGISLDVDNKTNTISVKGYDKETVGQVAAEIRGFRPPDSYKGKGVRYEGERVRLKAGKSGQ
jgi:large subunit ribosomal protein L6